MKSFRNLIIAVAAIAVISGLIALNASETVAETDYVVYYVIEDDRLIAENYSIDCEGIYVTNSYVFFTQDFAARLQEEGIYVTGFYYPVVPKGQARIRVQVSAGHEVEHLDKCIAAFTKISKELGVLK